MPPLRLRFIHSPTPDWEAMRLFYRDVLALPEAGGWDLPEDRGAFFEAPAGEVEVMEQDASELGILPEGTTGWTLAVEVADLDGELERIRALGGSVVRGIEVRPWGGRDFAVEDPAGRPVLIYESAARSPEGEL